MSAPTKPQRKRVHPVDEVLPLPKLAAYGFQHDLDVAAASALNSMRVFAYLLSLLCLGAHVTCVALSALADGFDCRRDDAGQLRERHGRARHGQGERCDRHPRGDPGRRFS